MIAVQIVEIRWTKATRGAPRATERALLPRAFALLQTGSAYCCQHYLMREDDGFAAVLTKEKQAEHAPRKERSLLLREHDDGLLVLGLRWDAAEGQPRRSGSNIAIRLAPGHSARLVLNGRHTSSHGQEYSEVIYNVAYGDTIARERFLGCEPDQQFSLAAHLF
ncbi:hypothetical protein [Massilia antarctica]|uniref:hypothetical protein n=1 Tax=Massilia antarctica TaxID=2765360 RepID=UPI0006BB71C1|nr:hypothetical protein [Massilia sp. H27-R4]MCY0913382.1 hypothetical protein [Massilia sp. H27-R4]CUI09513.1 hypothetical protein BN2497_13803 [Janthinobacterium sp. CG23_2]CUU33299.1 hypothetical protein BN3177_13803 [Janthinobacterium sp. CG23_2]